MLLWMLSRTSPAHLGSMTVARGSSRTGFAPRITQISLPPTLALVEAVSFQIVI